MYISESEVPTANYGFVDGFGQLPWQRPRQPIIPVPQLQMPAFETITGFLQGSAALGGTQIATVNRTAEFIVRSWSGTNPITAVRLAGYINATESQSDLGGLRATAVRDALVREIGRLQSGLPLRINWTTEDRGLGSVAKVDIFIWFGAGQPPAPPLTRIPSPAEIARMVHPPLLLPTPETPEQRIQRILRTLPPPPLPRRSFNQMFWQRVDGELNSVMNRLNVPPSLRGLIRDGVRAAIGRGSEALLNEIVGATRLPGETQEAIRTTTRALLEVPIR